MANDKPGRGLVFLLDVDNTLLNNDRLKDDLAAGIVRSVGQADSTLFWDLYEEVRAEKEYVDFPTTLERLMSRGRQHAATAIGDMLATWDFRSYLYPHALDAITYLATLGLPVILSDGDPVFQPRKIEKSGLWAAVDGRVLIYVHKELEIPKIFDTYPAEHYVVIDDKPRILAILETACPTRFTTVLVRQGKYAAHVSEFSPTPECVVASIGDLRNLSRQQFLEGCGSDAQEPE